MRFALFALLMGWLAIAQQANYIILIETSQYTCGKPTQTAKGVLSDLLCNGSYGRVAIGTFYRKGERGYVDWKTTPVLEGGGAPCLSTLQTIRSRCDSIYAVHLLGALETALRGDYVQAPEIIVLASGTDVSPGLKDTDILKLARAKGVRIHTLSIGYLANDDRAQTLLKRLSGQFDEGSSQGLYQVANPQSSTYQNTLTDFLTSSLSKASTSTPPKESPVPSPTGAALDSPIDDAPSGYGSRPASRTPDYTIWILIGAGALVLIGLIVVLSSRKSAPPPPPPPAPASSPAPAIQAPPLPALRRLVIHYPHGTQEVQLSASPAPITLGRAPDNTVVISDTTVSSRHARLYLQGTQWYIQDLGSTNGTFVNNARVTQHPVRAGDQIRLGAIVIQIG